MPDLAIILVTHEPLQKKWKCLWNLFLIVVDIELMQPIKFDGCHSKIFYQSDNHLRFLVVSDLYLEQKT